MSEQRFKIGLVQYACDDDRGANVARAEAMVREVAARGANIVCLPELFNARYFCKAESPERFALAEPIPGPTVQQMQILAGELAVVLIVPIFERRAAGVYHNSAAVIDADGSLLGVYRKMHIPDDPLYYEKFYFTPGDVLPSGHPSYGAGLTDPAVQKTELSEPSQGTPARSREAAGFRVFETRYAAVGVLICWDQWYPEAARITSLLGAEVLFYPTAIGWHTREKAAVGADQADAWRTAQRAHAIANGVYVAAVNRIGHEPEAGTDGIEFFGRSFVADPFGRILAEAPENAPVGLTVTCERPMIEDTRRNWPFLRDRRIDAYGPITARFLDPET